MIRIQRIFLLFSLFLLPFYSSGQIFRSYTDVKDPIINGAVDFYIAYFEAFQGGEPVDYSKYWSPEQCREFKVPDLAVYAISSDYATYSFGAQNTIFYAKRFEGYVHIRSILSYKADETNNTVYAILNHYVKIPASGQSYQFMPPMERESEKYRRRQFGNVEYHFPATTDFDEKKAAKMQSDLSVILKKWNFSPVPIRYFFARTKEEMAAMRGFEYCYGDEQSVPTGISSPEERLIFSSGSGEDNLHEALHIYFNPEFPKSPATHGLIYYLAGGLGHDFQWFVNRLHDYLQQYPDTDISQFDTLISKDIMLHLDFTVMGLICKKVDEKEGVAGLKRLLSYDSVEALFTKEFKKERKDWNVFLRKLVEEYRIKI